MSKEQTLELINESMYSLMEFARKSRGPIKGFRPRDLSILFFIYTSNKEHQVTMSELAHNLKVTPAATSQIIAGYEKNGWVNRYRSQVDRRTVYVRISEEIQEQMLKKWNETQQKFSDFLDILGEEDCDNLYRILKKAIEYNKNLIASSTTCNDQK